MACPASLKCSLTIEKFNPTNAAIRTKEVFKNSELSLARNEFREVLLVVETKNKKKKFVMKNDDLKIHRKFVKVKLAKHECAVNVDFKACVTP